MRLVSFKLSGDHDFRCGIRTAAGIVEASELAAVDSLDSGGVTPLRTVRDVLALTATELGKLARASQAPAPELRRSVTLYSERDVRLGPPVPDPQKIICLGLNYRDHAAEAGLKAPEAPMFFAKFANSLVGPTDAIVPPAVTDAVDYEAELAVVIGRRASKVNQQNALDYVFGAMAFNDVSARDLQLSSPLWTSGKAIDTFGPCGPDLVSLDELGDIQALGVQGWVNGELVQDGNTSQMIFGVRDTIAWLTGFMTLEPGDIIATGTPAGVGNSRTPKLFLKPPDVVEVEIEGIGRLVNRVVAPD
jgi:acylpyruvate hydrolase